MQPAGEPFTENLRGIHHAQDPEKYNLYAGLANLAKQLDRLSSDVANLTKMVDEIRRGRA